MTFAHIDNAAQLWSERPAYLVPVFILNHSRRLHP